MYYHFAALIVWIYVLCRYCQKSSNLDGFQTLIFRPDPAKFLEPDPDPDPTIFWKPDLISETKTHCFGSGSATLQAILGAGLSGHRVSGITLMKSYTLIRIQANAGRREYSPTKTNRETSTIGRTITLTYSFFWIIDKKKCLYLRLS